MIELGYNYRLSDVACALGINQLKNSITILKNEKKSQVFTIKNLKKSLFFHDKNQRL